MKIFHKDADYAVRTLLYLIMNGDSEFVSVTRISDELGFPLNFLRRICSNLIKAEILETKEGSKGGVRICKEASGINLLKIIELFHGKPELSDCMYRKSPCPNRGTCPLRARILKIEDTVSREFENITIQTLIDDLTTPLIIERIEP